MPEPRFGVAFSEYPVLDNEPLRPWLFTFICTPPTAVFGGSAADSGHLTLVTRTAEIPGMTIGEAQDFFLNQTFFHATKYTPETISASFQVGMSSKNALKILYEWCNLIANWTSTFTTGYAKDYKSDVTVKVWEHAGMVPVMSFVLVRAWPQGTPKLGLDYSSTELAKIDVTWRFDRWFIMP